MKKILVGLFVFISAFSALFADSFTDAIQDLAIQTACVRVYSATQAGGGWYEDPVDFYQPNMMAERFAKLSGDMTRTLTFYGICFDYAEFAFNNIKKYKTWYNEQGMYEGQFWLAGVSDNPNQIELSSIGTSGDHTRKQNGVYIKTYSTSMRQIKTHQRATYHAWLWIERADGVWFWIDPTWTDNLGYVVYGYVANGEEIQCRPDRKYDSPLLNARPSDLDFLPLPPAMGSNISPSKSANSANREETIKDAGKEWIDGLIIEDSDAFMKRKTQTTGMDDYAAFPIFVEVPLSSITNAKDFTKNLTSMNKIGIGLETSFSFPDTMTRDDFFYHGINLGFEYLQNLENGNNLRGGLFLFDFSKRLFNNFALFAGGGAGLRFDFSNKYWEPKKISGLADSGCFAFKADAGFIINVSYFFAKAEISYNNVFGFSVGAGVGVGIKLY